MGTCTNCGVVVPEGELTLLCCDEYCHNCMVEVGNDLERLNRGE